MTRYQHIHARTKTNVPKGILVGNNAAVDCQASLVPSVHEPFAVRLSETKQRFYDIKRDPYIEIVNIEAMIERRPTVIDETSSRVLKYRSPSFTASVKFRFSSIRSSESWQVGFVQACDYMSFRNQYRDLGYSSWEFPQLIVGDASMINDSCGRNYPWYGVNNQVVSIRGPIYRPVEYTISMRDLFAPWVPWDAPTYDDDPSCLTRIHRHQRFYVWLCAMNCTKNELLILRTIRWAQTIEIDVKPDEFRGRRATLVSDPEPNQPVFLRKNILIPTCALQGPSANDAQLLLWKPAKGNPMVVVNPKHHDRSSTRYFQLLNTFSSSSVTA